jgi:hypothetical protein
VCKLQAPLLQHRLYDFCNCPDLTVLPVRHRRRGVEFGGSICTCVGGHKRALRRIVRGAIPKEGQNRRLKAAHAPRKRN